MKQALQQEQAPFYRIFKKQCEQHAFSHAYLLEGRYQTKEAALYMAASMVCEEGTDGACEQCARCQRVYDLNYADLVYIDGQSTSIKKDDILKLQQRFMTSTLERNSRKIYILDGVENATDEAMNALLKFLEEPEGQSTNGILLTKQRHQVLPTILSRCQVYRLRDAQASILYEQAIAMQIDPEEAFFLSKTLQSPSQLNAMEEDIQFKETLGYVRSFTVEFFKRETLGIVFAQSLVSTKKMDREGFKRFLDYWILYLEELMLGNSRFNQVSSTQTNLRRQRFLHYLTTSITIRDRITRSVNVGLLVDQWGFILMEGTL